jgi:hypothetical protein
MTDNALQAQAKVSAAAVAAEIQDKARRELDTLRSTLNTHLIALERALAYDEADPIVERITADWTTTATDHAEAAAAQARLEAEQAAKLEIAAVRSEARSTMEAARAEFDDQLGKEREAHKRSQSALQRALTDLEGARKELESNRKDLDRAKADLDRVKADAERVKTELAEAERGRTAARAEAASLAENLEAVRQQLAATEQERSELTLARDIAEAHLEGERHARVAAAADVDAMRAKLLHAESDARAMRLELQRAGDRLRAVDAQPGAEDDRQACVALERVRSGLRTLSGVTSGKVLRDVLLEQLAPVFERVALCLVTPQKLVVWGSRGFDPPLTVNGAIAVPDDSRWQKLLTAESEAMTINGDGRTTGLTGSAFDFALAVPLMTLDRGVAIFYGENLPAGSDPSLATLSAQIMVEQVRQRVRQTQPGTPNA